MNFFKKNIALILMLVLIVGAIWYLGKANMKVGPANNNNIVGENISVQSSAASSTESLQAVAAADQKNGDKPAIEINDPTGFVNTTPFKLADLVGKKVVLLDFWTYSCINCIRTLPYLTAWYQKYQDQGLEIVGVHTPEFEFEKNYANVETAVQKYGIKYPVVLDSNYGTWQAYGNLYWPHEYLIDIAGYVVHDHIGEGDYDVTEAEIQKLLQQRNDVLGMNQATTSLGVVVPQTDFSGIQSPETYFGAAKNEFLANGNIGVLGDQLLQEPSSIDLNKLYLVGNWHFENEYATNLQAGAKIIFKYHSAKVFFVGSASQSVNIRVLEDGVPLTGANAGSDVLNGNFSVQESRLYNVINNSNGSSEHTLELIIDAPGLQAYTFTFG